ncbi:MAG: CocE/NonD family hydrolase [Bacteroidota bacterium]
MHKVLLVVLIIFFNLSYPTIGNVWVPEIFSEGMVLQRGKEIKIWGSASPGERVAVTLRGRSAVTRADRKGEWQVSIEPLSAGGPYVMNILGRNLITINNVMIGDVWLVTGDQFDLSTNQQFKAEKVSTKKKYPIRFFKAETQLALKPLKKVVSKEKWKANLTTDTITNSFFWQLADSLYHENRVPTAFIFSQYKNASLQTWIHPDSLKKYPEFQDTLAIMERHFTGINNFIKKRKGINILQKYPSIVYNGMVSPFASYSLKGVIWQQNAVDAKYAFYVEKLLFDLISSFRGTWNDTALPFLILNDRLVANEALLNSYYVAFLSVQSKLLSLSNLAIFNSPFNAEEIPVSNIIHLIEALDERNERKFKAPKPNRFQIEGKKVKLYFSANNTLKFKSKYGYGKGFSIASYDKVFKPAKAFAINDSTLIVHSDLVEKPVAVRYAFSNFLRDANLSNKNDIVVLPFKTDNWADVTDTSSFRTTWLATNAIDTTDMVNRFQHIIAKMPPPKAKKNPDSLVEWKAQRPFYYEKLIKSLGFNLQEWEKRPPIQSRYIGKKIEFLEYTIQKLVYQSQPNFWVPVNLYIPKGVEFPRPAILYLNGHSGEGKSTKNYQRSMISLVKKGYIVMSIDEIGAGERKFTGQQSPQLFLTGHSPGGWQIWDASRAIDFLYTKNNLVAKDKIGVTGRSGGGFQSFYLAAADDRVKATAPIMYVSSFEGMVTSNVSHTLDNYLPSIRKYMEQHHVMNLIAPRPILIGAGKKDFFSIESTKRTVSKAKKIYQLYGDSVFPKTEIVDIGHKDTIVHREAVYSFFNQVLGIDASTKEPESQANSDSILNVGMPIYSTATLEDLANSALKKASKRSAFTTKKPVFKSSLIELLDFEQIGKRSLEIPHNKQVVIINDSIVEESIVLNTEYNIQLVAKLSYNITAENNRPTVLLGRQENILKDSLIKSGFAVFSINLRRGSNTENLHRNKTDIEYLSYTNSVFLGKPLIGQKTYDYIRAVDYLVTRNEIVDTTKIFIVTTDTTVNKQLAALLATAFDERIKSIYTANNLLTFFPPSSGWKDWHFATYLPHFSEIGDIQDIISLIAPRKVKIINPRATDGSILTNYEIQKYTNRCSYEYRKLRASNNLSISTEPINYRAIIAYLIAQVDM